MNHEVILFDHEVTTAILEALQERPTTLQGLAKAIVISIGGDSQFIHLPSWLTTLAYMGYVHRQGDVWVITERGLRHLRQSVSE
jgi:hypothetical protein